MPNNTVLSVDGTEVTLSNLEKVFYPTGFTKGEVIDYYIRIAPALLPHIQDRPITLKRYPNGATGKFFYQKSCPKGKPPWVHTLPVWSEGRGENISYCLMDSLPALIWAANMAALELHPSLSAAADISRPTVMVFDLDPGPPAAMTECAEVALMLRAILDKYGLASYPKTSGSKGLQVYVPLHTPCTYEQTKDFSRLVATTLESHRPDLVVAKMKKTLRTGKVFIDWSQNDEHKTTVSVYSLRAKDRPTPSAPVSWQEVGAVYQGQNPGLIDFDCAGVLQRFEKYGDLFAPVLTVQQKLPYSS